MKRIFFHNKTQFGRYSPDTCHENLFGLPSLAYSAVGKDCDYKTRLLSAFKKTLGDMPEATSLELIEEYRKDFGTHLEIRLLFRTEKDCFCPAYLVLPKNIEKPPVVICLQGHSTGMEISLGRPYRFKDYKTIEGNRDFALEAVRHGYGAMVLEQRCFGERESSIKGGRRCDFTAYNALLLGRTLIGERIFDVSRAIDVLERNYNFVVDTTKIGCVGNSGGGTITYYAACVEPRISIAMAGSAVCTYKASIGSRYHCSCNYLPSAAKYFDMGDLAALIAPRPLVIVSGKKDTIFPQDGVQECYRTIKQIYSDTGATDNCTLVVGDGGHRFYKSGWDAFDGYAARLNWKK